MADLRDIVIDCANAPSLARWWAQVLDGYDVRPYTEEDIAWLAERGMTPETDRVVMLDGPGPTICFQQVPEPKSTKNRVHLDVSSPDRAAEVTRLLELGATVFGVMHEWTTMLDPEGNEFCVLDPKP